MKPVQEHAEREDEEEAQGEKEEDEEGEEEEQQKKVAQLQLEVVPPKSNLQQPLRQLHESPVPAWSQQPRPEGQPQSCPQLQLPVPLVQAQSAQLLQVSLPETQ